MRRVLATGALVAAIIVLVASPASAHAELTGSDPESGATLPAGQSPDSITLHFTERVELPQDAIRVLAGSGNAVQGVGAARHGGDDSVVTASLPRLADGTYVVDWRVVSTDSHPINGAYTFADLAVRIATSRQFRNHAGAESTSPAASAVTTGAGHP